jgi:hypothetical protein
MIEQCGPTEVRIRVLGKLWMPNTQAATELTITVGTGPFQVDIDPTDVDAVWGYVDTHTGDFSAITAIDVEISTPVREQCWNEDGEPRWSYDYQGSQPIEFTQYEENDWATCMFGLLADGETWADHGVQS